MSDFNPGPGWRQVTQQEFLIAGGDRFTGYFDGIPQYWVREEVPRLPNKPHTVIRTKGREGFPDLVLTLNEQGHWAKHNAVIPAAELRQMITGFEVLSEPRVETATLRRETAQAVLDRVWERTFGPGIYENTKAEIAREFGVES